MPISSELFSPAMRGTLRNAVGSLTLPGLNADETVVLVYALLWLLPVFLCVRRVRVELTETLALRYREGGGPWLLAGVLALVAFLAVLALYALSALSVMTWGRAGLLAAWPVTVKCISSCTTFWAWVAPGSAPLHLAPVAVLATALSAHGLAEVVGWLSTYSLRAARHRRTRAVLAQLEAQQSQDDKPRGTIRYW